MTAAPFDLDAYLRRVGYSGPRAANLKVLRALHALQPAAIPFENLDPLLGRKVELDLGALAAKLVEQRRGGYCFELNGLFAAALEALGFRVIRLAARVRWRAPPERLEGARSHMLLKVDLDEGAFLADVGFGALLMDAPLRLISGVEQQSPSATLRLREEDDGRYTLQARLPEEWGDVYRFNLEPQLASDYALANWFTATHPDSLFRNNLLMERLLPDRRVTLFNTRLVERPVAGEARERILAGAAELNDVIADVFGIASPVSAADIWARIAVSP